MRRLTASKLYIAINCAHFLRDDVQWHKGTTTYATTGSGTHEANDQLVKGELPDLRAIAEQYGMSDRERSSMDALIKRYVDWFATQDTTAWRSEVKLAWDPFEDKPIKIRSKAPRDYSELDGTIAVCGTADLAYPVEIDPADPIACIDDIKTGFGRQVDPVVQGGMLTMMMAERIGASRGRFRVIQVQEDNEVRPRVFDLTTNDLLMVKRQIGEVIRVALNEPDPSEGPWCRYCPARVTCAATQHAVSEAEGLIPSGALVRGKHKLVLVPTDDEHAAWTHTAIALARAALDAAEKGLREYADTRDGVRLADGTLFKGWPTGTRKLTLTPAAIDVLKGFRLDTKAIEQKATLGSITKAAGGAKMAEPVFKALEEAGAITVEPGTKYEPRKVAAA